MLICFDHLGVTRGTHLSALFPGAWVAVTVAMAVALTVAVDDIVAVALPLAVAVIRVSVTVAVTVAAIVPVFWAALYIGFCCFPDSVCSIVKRTREVLLAPVTMPDILFPCSKSNVICPSNTLL